MARQPRPSKRGSAEGALLQAQVARTEAGKAEATGNTRAANKLTRTAVAAERAADTLLLRGQIRISG